MTPEEVFRNTRTALVIDWPSREVPEQLALAGICVVVRGGPGPEDFSAYEATNGEVAVRRTGRPPERADLVYTYRPLGELAQAIATARDLHASAIWIQSGVWADGARDARGCWLPAEELEAARKLVESAGLHFISEPYIGDVAQQIRRSR